MFTAEKTAKFLSCLEMHAKHGDRVARNGGSASGIYPQDCRLRLKHKVRPVAGPVGASISTYFQCLHTRHDEDTTVPLTAEVPSAPKRQVRSAVGNVPLRRTFVPPISVPCEGQIENTRGSEKKLKWRGPARREPSAAFRSKKATSPTPDAGDVQTASLPENRARTSESPNTHDTSSDQSTSVLKRTKTIVPPRDGP
eukprot:2311294-Rhodomonas_salina.1